MAAALETPHPDACKLRATPIKRTCLKCRAKKVVSLTELERVYPSRSEAMQAALQDDTDTTHICCGCETAYEFVGDVPDRHSPDRTPTELTLSGVM